MGYERVYGAQCDRGVRRIPIELWETDAQPEHERFVLDVLTGYA